MNFWLRNKNIAAKVRFFIHLIAKDFHLGIYKFIKPFFPAGWQRNIHYFKLGIMAKLNRGNTHYCACCDKQFKGFEDMGEGSHPRKNVRCPGCHSMERHRMLAGYLEKEKEKFFFNGCRILYLAPVVGVIQVLKNIPDTTYKGADLDSIWADEHFDLMDIPHPDSSFDFILCSHILAHVHDDKKALRELLRTLSPKGHLILLDRIHDIPTTMEASKNTDAKEREKIVGQSDRFRKYGLDFKQRIQNEGWNIEEIDYASTLSPASIHRQRLRTDEFIYVCKRSF